MALGSDGFGMSDTREALRDHFEVDARWTAYAALHALMADGVVTRDLVVQAAADLELNLDKRDPVGV